MYGCNQGYRQDDIDINITNQNVNSNTNENFYAMGMGGYGSSPVMENVMSPVVEPGRERIVNRTFVHEVPHA